MKCGNLQRRWSETRPAEYDKETRIVRFDIQETTKKNKDDEEVEGYSYVQVEIDKQIEYGHIKSQLIEAGFAPKDEFGLLMNSVDVVVKAIKSNTTIASMKATLNDDESISDFEDFCQYREICAEAARKVMDYYK